MFGTSMHLCTNHFEAGEMANNMCYVWSMLFEALRFAHMCMGIRRRRAPTAFDHQPEKNGNTLEKKRTNDQNFAIPHIM